MKKDAGEKKSEKRDRRGLTKSLGLRSCKTSNNNTHDLFCFLFSNCSTFFISSLRRLSRSVDVRSIFGEAVAQPRHNSSSIKPTEL